MIRPTDHTTQPKPRSRCLPASQAALCLAAATSPHPAPAGTSLTSTKSDTVSQSLMIRPADHTTQPKPRSRCLPACQAALCLAAPSPHPGPAGTSLTSTKSDTVSQSLMIRPADHTTQPKPRSRCLPACQAALCLAAPSPQPGHAVTYLTSTISDTVSQNKPMSKMIRPTDHTTVGRTWQELTRNSDSKLIMMRVIDVGQQRTTRKKTSRNKHREEQEVATARSKKYVKKTSPVKIASAKKIQQKTTNSPNIKNLKRLKPRNLSEIASSMNNCHQKLNCSPRKSLNFKNLVSKWEQLSSTVLTPAVVERPRLSDFVDSQSYRMIQKSEEKKQI